MVELWQFKYCKDIINISINQERGNEDNNSEIDLSRGNSTSTSSEHLWDFNPSDSEVEKSITISEHSISQSNNNYIKLFTKLPWNKLPYGLLIIESKNDKYLFGLLLYDKYFNNYSYDMLNISYNTKNIIINNINNIKHLKNIGKDEDNEEYDNILFTLFDAAIEDVIQNLQHVMHRFRTKNVFKELIKIKK